PGASASNPSLAMQSKLQRILTVAPNGEHPCEISIDLLSRALQLFFSHTVVKPLSRSVSTDVAPAVGAGDVSSAVQVSKRLRHITREASPTIGRYRRGTVGDEVAPLKCSPQFPLTVA